MSLQRILLAARCAALVALCFAGVKLISPQSIPRESQPATVYGAAALEQLKREGPYESLQAAMSAARFSVNRLERTSLDRSAWQASNAAAGYDDYVTETGVSLAVKKADDNQPLIATSNHPTGVTFNRHVTTGLCNDGAFKRFAASSTVLVVDLVGFFAP